VLTTRTLSGSQQQCFQICRISSSALARCRAGLVPGWRRDRPQFATSVGGSTDSSDAVIRRIRAEENATNALLRAGPAPGCPSSAA